MRRKEEEAKASAIFVDRIPPKTMQEATTSGTSDSLDSDGVPKKKKKEDLGPTVSYYKLYRYATLFDGFLLFVGCLAALINGAGIPVLFIFFGDITDAFTNYGRYEQCDFDYDKCVAMGLTTLTEPEFDADVLAKTDNFREEAVKIVMYMVYIGCATFTCSALQIACFSLSSVRQMREVRIRYFRAILRQDIAFHDQTKSGELNVRLSSDINKVADGTGEKISSLLQYISMSVSGITIGLVYTWKMGLVTLCVAPLIGVASTVFFLVTSVYTKKELAAYASAGAIAEEAITAIRTVTSLGCQSRFNDRYSANLASAKKTGIERGTLTGMSTGSLYLCMYGAYGLAFWYGTTLVLSGEIDVGDMMTTFFGIIIGAFALGTAASYFGAISEAKAAAAKIFEVIDRVPVIDVFSSKGGPPSEKGTIELRRVEFAYPSRPDAQVLKQVSLQVEHGQTVALVGHSGCGKSTIIQLIQRFYDVLGGEILIAENPIKELNIAQLRKTIGVVAQEPVLFATTVAENIRWGKDDATEAEIHQAAKLANAYNFIMEMPAKFDTHVGEGGGQMSGGQKQRIAIARAILRNPKILLLDEATSALDTESEAIVQSALDKASQGRTTIVVAHRLSTVRKANKIIAFDGGRVVESGTHDELLALGGVYASLCKTQQFIKELDEDNETEPQQEKLIKSDIDDLNPPVDVLPNRVDTLTKSQINKAKSTSLDELDGKEKKKKEEEEKVSVKRLLKLNKPEWGYMGIGAFWAVVAGAADPVSAIIFSEFLVVFTYSDQDLQKQRSIEYAIAFAGIGVAAFLAYSLEAGLFSKAGMELTTRLRKQAFAAILRQEISYFDDPENNTGVLCSRLASDATKVQGCTGGKLGLVMKNFSSLGVALGISFAYSWKLTLLMLAFIPFIIIGGMVEMQLIMGDEEKVKKEYAKSSQIASEAITNIRTIASLTREETAIENYTKILDIPIKKKKKKSLYMGIAYGYSQCIIFFTYAAVFRLGIELVIWKDTSFDNVFKVVTAILFGAMAVAQNSSFAPDFAEAQTAAFRILQLIDLVPSIDSYSDEGHKPSHCSGEIQISSAFFRYPTRQEVTVLNGLSISVKPGQTLALVGQSGCGKSTTIQLLERFYDVNEGEVMVDGTDVKKLNVAWLRQQIGLVSQEPTLFDLSIKENIRYGDSTRVIDKDEVIIAASKANAHNFISALPEAYETSAGAKGGQLSGGQKQRIAIARALIRNPKILLLDEATSALDSESERIVQEAIDVARSGRTCIVIAHRLSTIKNADQIAVVDKGAIIECGSHDELVAAKGAYYKMLTGVTAGLALAESSLRLLP